MSAILSMRSVTKAYRGLTAIQDVSIDIDALTITSIVGPNGAGKSTLFNLISGYVRPTSGRIFSNGMDITSLPTYRIAELGIARAFQIAKPFPDLSVESNINVTSIFRLRGCRG